MTYLVTDCPHCHTANASMAGVAFVRRDSDQRATGFFMCSICMKPVSAWIDQQYHIAGAGTITDLHKWKMSLSLGGWVVIDLWPEPQKTTAPDDVPANVARNFIQAEEAAAKGHRESAGMTYRRSLELALKDKAPELTGMLNKRIDKLATDGRLTADLAEWAHVIRELGNESAHDEIEPTAEDTAELAAFTRVVLEYLYTMPAKVARRSGATPPS